ncbi:MAG: class I SAM-dependent rRNA methyltransferase [Bacteroidales bacterium]|nr:class I SAM-dependent rRNA methyltransferase [Bacteroidales bacterium]
MNYPQIILKKSKEQSLKRRHPWVFSGAIDQLPFHIYEGDLVEVLDYHRNFLGIGHYQPDSIAVRILSFNNEPINQAFWNKKIETAYIKRKNLGLIDNPSTNVFRLIHGEGDELPGLIADYYNGIVVIQCHSAGMYLQRNAIAQAIKNVFPEIKAIYNKSFLTLPPLFNNKEADGFLWGEHSTPIEIIENNLRFNIDFIEGQKTGFFIDQRENRMLLGSLSKNKKVANLFGYTGGFAIYAAHYGASEVINVDSSAKALEMATNNYQLNKFTQIKNICSDVNDFFKACQEHYDIVILDPPAFAKHHKHREKALLAYKNLNIKGLKLLSKGGFLFTFSCSQAISANDLRQAIFVAAANEKRNVSILYQLHQPADHPISIFHPEGEYLKGFVLKVE